MHWDFWNYSDGPHNWPKTMIVYGPEDALPWLYGCPNGHETTLHLTREQMNKFHSKLAPEEIMCGACGCYAPLIELSKSLRDVDKSARAVREYTGVMGSPDA